MPVVQSQSHEVKLIVLKLLSVDFSVRVIFATPAAATVEMLQPPTKNFRLESPPVLVSHVATIQEFPVWCFIFLILMPLNYRLHTLINFVHANNGALSLSVKLLVPGFYR